jgi:hypothetical protein
MVPIMQISIPVKKLFQLVKDFRHATYKDIHEEKINEALKDAYPYKISNDGPQMIRSWFDTAKGSTVTTQMAVMDDYYLATLAHYTDFDMRDVKGITGDDVWEFFFKRDGSVELTNKGDQFKIFATVVSIFREFVKRKNPKVIAFSSSKHEEGGKGRTPLYKRFAATFAKESGYRLKEFDLFDEYYFLLFAPGIQIESMSVMERACLEGGHSYERDLEEIAKIPPLKNDDANLQRMPQRIKQIKDGLFTKITELNDNLDLYMSNDLARYGRDGYVIVTDKALTTVMSLLRVYSAGNMVVYAGMAWTHPKHRRQGLSTILYEALLSKGFHLETDSSQTTSGKAIWKHLISKHGGYLLRDGEIDRPVKTDKDFEQAYKRNAPYNYTLLIKSPQTELNLGENISITGTNTSKEDRKRNLIPGSDDWFKHWFSLPYLRREDVDRLKEEATNYIKNRKGVKNEKKTRNRRDPRN